ncbi:hypothetical protein [Acetobacter sp.]|uniref:hypothetical protein n=1 Tax=Acetobacter sp. TaxID=440 RepID=UPI0039E798B4
MADGGLLNSVAPTALGALCGWLGGGVGGFFSSKHEKQKALQQREKEVSVYREPLAHAAFDLQSRIYNILERRFLNRMYVNGTERTREYSVENTSFLMAQLFCWFELTRQELYYIELKKAEDTEKLMHLQDHVQTLWGADRAEYQNACCIFAGEQRAIGENLIIRRDGISACMGYAQFMDTFPPGKNKQMDIVRAEVRELAADDGHAARTRLVKIQHYLIDILTFLDPDSRRFPRESTKKM